MGNTNIDFLPEESQDSFSNDDLFNITSWGADITLREIISSYEDGDYVKPELQRKYVWDKKDASRFIESILLGLPVPSIFLANNSDERKLIVDGYQRIMTIFNFYNGVWSSDGSVFNLTDSERINKRWRGKTFKELIPEDQRRFKMYTIHAIIFEQRTPRNDDGLFQIFERINTSGKSLNAQEIRNCVYQGNLNSLLFKLNKNEHWRELFGEKTENNRMLDLEFILRFFTLRQETILHLKSNSISLKKQLNEFMRTQSKENDFFYESLEKDFTTCIDFIHSEYGKTAFHNLRNDLKELRKKFYPTVYDSLMIATDIALRSGFVPQEHILEEKRICLLRDPEYRESITQGTMQLHNIRTRISKALKYLYNIDYIHESE